MVAKVLSSTVHSTVAEVFSEFAAASRSTVTTHGVPSTTLRAHDSENAANFCGKPAEMNTLKFLAERWSTMMCTESPVFEIADRGFVQPYSSTQDKHDMSLFAALQ